MSKPKSKYVFQGEVYQVRERMLEDNGISGEWDDEPDWYEYDVALRRPDGSIVAEWDSLSETYNGFQKLTKSEAEESLEEVRADVKAGKASRWFNVPDEPTPAKRSHKSTTKRGSKSKRSSPPSISLSGVRR